MENGKDPARKTPDKKLPALNNNVVWYLLGLGVLTLLIVMVLTSGSEESIAISDLVRLVKQIQTEKKIEGVSVDVLEAHGNTNRRIRYSDLADVKIGNWDVTGKVTKETFSANGKTQERAPEKNVAFRTWLKPGDNGLSKMLLDAGVHFAYTDAPSALRSYIPMLVLTALVILVFFFMMRRLGGAGSPMAFGRSRGKMYAQEDLGVTFEDVAGIDEAVEELREVVEFLRTPEKY